MENCTVWWLDCDDDDDMMWNGPAEEDWDSDLTASAARSWLTAWISISTQVRFKLPCCLTHHLIVELYNGFVVLMMMLFISLVCLLYDKNVPAYQRLYYRKVAWQLRANVFHHFYLQVLHCILSKWACCSCRFKWFGWLVFCKKK